MVVLSENGKKLLELPSSVFNVLTTCLLFDLVRVLSAPLIEEYAPVRWSFRAAGAAVCVALLITGVRRLRLALEARARRASPRS
jgi:hypothetical protein